MIFFKEKVLLGGLGIFKKFKIRIADNFITVTAQEAKNKKIRRIAINKSLRELLLKLNLTRNGNRYVFENPKTGKTVLKSNIL